MSDDREIKRLILRVDALEKRLNNPILQMRSPMRGTRTGIQWGTPFPATQDEIDSGDFDEPGAFIGFDTGQGELGLHVQQGSDADNNPITSSTESRAFLGWSIILSAVAGIVKNSTAFLAITNSGQSGTESDRDFYVPSACRLQNFRVYMETNDTGTNDNTVTIRDGAVSTSLTVTYDSGETGLKEDLVNTHEFAAGATLTVEVVNTATSGGGVKNLGVRMISVECVML